MCHGKFQVAMNLILITAKRFRFGIYGHSCNFTHDIEDLGHCSYRSVKAN